jgi:uncharacterized integral membrane protein
MMTLRTLSLSYMLVISMLIMVHHVSCHIAWQSPVPRNSDSGIKGPYPCGNEAPKYGDTNNGYTTTTYSPGGNIIYWHETINHHGAPFRIALSMSNNDNDYDQYILLDHLPHNDKDGGGSFASPKVYAYNLTLPDVACSNCSLQIINPMTDKQSPCSYPYATSTTSRCNSVYHSCANIIITGRLIPSQYATIHINPASYDYHSGESAAWIDSGSVWYHLIRSLASFPFLLVVIIVYVVGIRYLPGNLNLGERSKLPLILTATLVPIGGILIIAALIFYCRRVRQRQILRMNQIKASINIDNSVDSTNNMHNDKHELTHMSIQPS